MKFLVVFALSLSLGVMKVLSLDCYFCEGPLAYCSSSMTNRSCRSPDLGGPLSTAVCVHGYRTDIDYHERGCFSSDECLSLSTRCQDGTYSIPCVAQCCSEDFCNI
ncbi:uncharacterized protein [Montipora foliosa]|uniref:uncharacterized protein n=1 Tax=Montipora foliosa TaxID=591990 RepID=UPI0035F13969